MKQLSIVVLKWCFYGGVSLHRLCVPSVFGVRAGFDADASHVFPHGVLATITLIEGVAGDGGARACTGCEVGLPLCSLAVATLSGVESAPTLLERKLWGRA